MLIRSLTGLIFAIAMLSEAGCSSSADSEGEQHLEHAIPEHKPANYAEAVDDIRQRLERISSEEVQQRGEAYQELCDVIGWIPELAADSDLDEADWNTAEAASQQLLKGLPDSAARAQWVEEAADDGPLHTLQSLIEAAGEPEPRIPGHDDHSHDHHHHDHDDD